MAASKFRVSSPRALAVGRSLSGYNTLMLPGAFRRLLPAALTLTLLGLGGMVGLVITTYPVLWARWLFFLCLVAAAAGLSMPIFALLHRRFSQRRPVSERTVLRESLWVGAFVGFLAWLQLGRALSPLAALFAAVAVALLELLLLVSEQSRRP